MNVTVEIVKLPGAIDLPTPHYAHDGDAACDLYAAISHPYVLYPGARALIPCGISIALPDGYEAQIRPRSGLAIKHGVTVLNSPGCVDASYRGPICAILINHGNVAFEVHRGMRIAQMVVAPVSKVRFQDVDTLDETTRGDGGFGSTGV